MWGPFHGKVVAMTDRDRVLKHAEEVFGSPENAFLWLRRPRAVLGHATPIELLDTPEGIQQVEVVLGRIEHGVYS